MAIIPVGEKYVIYDYNTNKTYAPLEGQIVYLEDVQSYIQNTLSVIGDGTNQVQNLPFREIINIESSINLSLENIRIAGNKTIIHNTAGSIKIQINIGTSGSPKLLDLYSGNMIFLKFNGSNWIELINQNQYKVDSTYTITDKENYIYYKILSEPGNKLVTLPLYANNKNKKPFIIQNIENGIARINTQGADLINGYLNEVRLYSKNDYVEIYPSETGWSIRNQYVTLDSGIINRTDWTNAKLGTIAIGYDNITLGAPLLGGYIQGVTSGVIGKIEAAGTINLRLIEVQGGGIFLDNEIINGLDFSFSASVNEPTGSNLNKDTNIGISGPAGIADRMHQIETEFLVFPTLDPTAFLKPVSVAYRTTTPLANEYSGYTYYWVSDSIIAMSTGIDGISLIDNTGIFVLLQAQDWYYRQFLRIKY